MSDEERIIENNEEQPGDLSEWDTPPGQLARLQELVKLSQLPANEVLQVKGSSDKKARGEEISFEAAKEQAELDKLNADIKGLLQDTEQRRAYAG